MSPKSFVGFVISDKMDKTAVVTVETKRRHPQYKRVTTRKRKFKVHDEGNACHIGDLVRIIETRPLSKEKRWRVSEILSKGKTVETSPTEIE